MKAVRPLQCSHRWQSDYLLRTMAEIEVRMMDVCLSGWLLVGTDNVWLSIQFRLGGIEGKV